MDESIITALAGFTLTIKGKKPTNNIHIVCNPKDKVLPFVLFPSCKPSRNFAGSIQQRTFIHFAKYPKWKTGKWIKSEEELPAFPECVFEHLPPFLNEVVNNSISLDDRDTILIGAIVCLSVCFHNICGVYDERIVYPNLYLFVVADAGMGKGALTLCRELVAPINRNLHELSKRLELEYKEAMNAYIKGKKDDGMTMPTEPPMRMLVIPANSSASSFLKILGDNDGIGLLFESEGDTLSQTLKSDYGNYSDVLRKAFHHELVSLSRRKDREYCEVSNPRVSVALAGTPEQVRTLIPDAENGLMSRFCFISFVSREV